jgi:hypothetical protein
MPFPNIPWQLSEASSVSLRAKSEHGCINKKTHPSILPGLLLLLLLAPELITMLLVSFQVLLSGTVALQQQLLTINFHAIQEAQGSQHTLSILQQVENMEINMIRQNLAS